MTDTLSPDHTEIILSCLLQKGQTKLIVLYCIALYCIVTEGIGDQPRGKRTPWSGRKDN